MAAASGGVSPGVAAVAEPQRWTEGTSLHYRAFPHRGPRLGRRKGCEGAHQQYGSQLTNPDLCRKPNDGELHKGWHVTLMHLRKSKCHLWRASSSGSRKPASGGRDPDLAEEGPESGTLGSVKTQLLPSPSQGTQPREGVNAWRMSPCLYHRFVSVRLSLCLWYMTLCSPV